MLKNDLRSISLSLSQSTISSLNANPMHSDRGSPSNPATPTFDSGNGLACPTLRHCI